MFHTPDWDCVFVLCVASSIRFSYFFVQTELWTVCFTKPRFPVVVQLSQLYMPGYVGDGGKLVFGILPC